MVLYYAIMVLLCYMLYIVIYYVCGRRVYGDVPEFLGLATNQTFNRAPDE